MLALEGEADQRDEVGEAAGLGATFDFLRRDGSEGVPEAVFGLGGVFFAELFLQLFEHRLCEPVAVGTTVEKLERCNLGSVLFEIVAKRFSDLLGVLRRLLGGAGKKHAIAGDHVDHLLARLLNFDQKLAERRVGRERRGGLLHELAWAACKSFSVGWKY